MKNVLIVIVLGAIALAGGLGLIIAADHYGVIGDQKQAADVVQASVCEHDVDVARCPLCNPDLVDSMGWCKGHDVPEALCTRCSPDVIPAFKATNDWCGEHGLPESQCTKCGASTTPTQSKPDATMASLSKPQSSDNILRSQRPPSETCSNAFSTVQLKSPAVARRAGIRIEPLRTETIEQTVVCNAQVAFDGDRYAHLSSRAPGTIASVNVDLGQRVARGDVLAVVDSTELGSAKARLLQAQSLVELWRKNHEREQSLQERNVATEKDVLEAETKLVESQVELSNARQRLRNLGLSDDDIDAVAESGITNSQLPLRAPFDGVVVKRHAAVGEVIDTSTPLFSIADASRMWVMLDVYENDVPNLRVGQPVKVSLDAMDDRTFEGTLTWISSEVDPRTRTIRARAEVDNPDGLLRANMFGRAEIVVKSLEEALLVPEAAVQWDGCCNIVFVRHTDTIYQPYKVKLGYKRDGSFVVEDGLPRSESVVTQGSFLLKTEILKGNIGAGCCEVDPGATRSKEQTRSEP